METFLITLQLNIVLKSTTSQPLLYVSEGIFEIQISHNYKHTVLMIPQFGSQVLVGEDVRDNYAKITGNFCE
jgi:hypothetical protein